MQPFPRPACPASLASRQRGQAHVWLLPSNISSAEQLPALPVNASSGLPPASMCGIGTYSLGGYCVTCPAGAATRQLGATAVEECGELWRVFGRFGSCSAKLLLSHWHCKNLGVSRGSQMCDHDTSMVLCVTMPPLIDPVQHSSCAADLFALPVTWRVHPCLCLT
jgi:hypothetical protein